MAPSSGTFIIEGVKVSINLLVGISGDLPPPTSTVVGLAQQIITVVETLKDNQEQCQALIDRLLRLLLIILAAVKQQATTAQGRMETPHELLFKVDRFKDNLDGILKEVTKIQTVVNSGRRRDRLRLTVLAGSYQADIKKCYDQLDWTIKEFDVASRLADAIRLFKVARQVQKVLTNQYLEKLPIAKYARFDCERPDRPASCFPGTREAIIKEVIAWIIDPDPQAERFFWLNGLAGIGKTTVARTVAELARGLGLLGASFFFSRRGEAELRNPALVFPTIAHQLALFDRDFCDRITAAVEADAQAPSSSLKRQLDRLILEPLRGLERDPDRVVIILFDAFDECESVGAKVILQLLVAAIPHLPFFLKIFITSRPEPHIRSVLVPTTKKLRITALHDIEASVVNGDILTYLRANIRNLPEKKGVVMGSDWVTEEEIQLLAEAAGKLFVYAATAVRSLEEAYSLRRQLDVLLRLAAVPRSEKDRSSPFVYLDELYTEVLRNPITPANESQALELLQVVLGSLVLLRNPLPVDALERLVDIGSGEAVATLNTLQSVILPPAPPDYCPRTYHRSFPDYLQDPARCKPDTGLFIETKKHETRMAMCCLNLLNAKLHKGMLGDLAPGLRNSEVERLENRVGFAIPPELQYACRFWAAHLAKVPYPEDSVVQVVLTMFASHHLLPWLESMSWLGRTREAVDCLEMANAWVAMSSASSVTTTLLSDAYRLLLAYFPVITESALHIARSALPLAPRNTQLRATYTEYADLKVILGFTELEWSPCLMALSHPDPVFCIAISPDGTRIASGTRGESIRIHDASSGGFITALTGHVGPIWSVAFSPDGTQVASGSEDHTVRLWDAATDHELLRLEGHASTVFSVAFSPDGGRVASGSRDNTIRIHDAVTGRVITSLDGHSDGVNSIKFFPDGGQMASGSDDCTVRIWELAGGTNPKVLTGHSQQVWSVAVSSDGLRITSGSADGTVRIWDALNGASVATLACSGRPYSVAFSPSGDCIASGSMNSSVRLWNTATGDIITTFQGHNGSVRATEFSPDGCRLVCGSEDTTVKIWDVGALVKSSLQDLRGQRKVVSLAFCSRGTWLASLEDGGEVQLWDLVDARPVRSFPVKRFVSGNWSVHFSPDDTQIIVTHTNHSSTTTVTTCEAFETSTGSPTAESGIPALGIPSPSQPPFKVEGGKLVREDTSSLRAGSVCILPHSLQDKVSAISSFKLEGALGVGDRVAIGFKEGQVMVLDISR